MKKKVVALISFFLCVFSVFAAQNNISVPITNEVYRVIENAEVRGIIPAQPDVKPYTLGKIRSLLGSIKTSDSVKPNEIEYIDSLLNSLDRAYGGNQVSSVRDAFANGYITGFGNNLFEVVAGGRFSNQNTIGVNNGAKDIRNKVTAYIAGDMSNNISFYIDFGLLVDKLDHNAFLINDFTTECNGWYMGFSEGGARTQISPFRSFEEGLAMNPEIGASLFDGTLSFRFGAVKREWGPGINNLALAGSARSFDAIEFSFVPSSKFSFSVAMGSLGKAFLAMEGEAKPIGNVNLRDCTYDNNFSIQRIEISPIQGLRLAIFESVVYRKRFELAYLNPLSIYMFAQNYIGDFDNVLAGVDISYTLNGVGRVYLALSCDEFERIVPSIFFSWARNIVAIQGGVDIPVSFGSFGELTLQATYIPPFYGTHYTLSNEKQPFYNGDVKIDYINKGQPLSTPLYPDSIELLASFDTTINSNFSANITIKDQLRSAQYSVDEKYGTTMNDHIKYSDSSNYAVKDFFSYIWNNILDVELNGKYSFDSFPLSLKAGIQCIVETSKSFSVTESAKSANYNNGDQTTITSNWGDPSFRLIAKIGFDIYY